MSLGKILLGAGAAAGLVLIGGIAGSPHAGNCVVKQEDKEWSFLTFYNGCDQPINVIFCNKMTLGEIGKAIGYQTGEWDCRNHHVDPKRSFTTIKWVNKNSSVASHALSSSRYQVAACRAPSSPRFTNETTYVCEAN